MAVEEAKEGVGGTAMESVSWLVLWSPSTLGLENSPGIRKDLTFSFSWAGGRKTPTDVPFSIYSSDTGFSLAPKPSCQFANSVN